MIWKRTESGIEVGSVTLSERRVRVVTLMQRLWPKKTRYRVLVGVILLITVAVLGPYGYSRALSSSRALSLVTLDGMQVPDAAERDRDVLRVACYNIAHGRGLAGSNWEGGSAEERKERLDAIAALLREIDADVVVLNEVDFDASWSYSVDQADDIARLAGYPHIAKLRNLDFVVGLWRWRFGNAVLSRHPIVEAHEIKQPGYSAWETRLAGQKRSLFCEIEVGEQTIGIVAVHLSHRSEALRADSAQRLIDFAKGYGEPLILAGDFNSTPTGFPDSATDPNGRNAMDLIDAAGLFHRLPAEPPNDPSQFTFRSDDPARVIDWILVSESITVTDHAVVASELSDHRPVVVNVLLDE